MNSEELVYADASLLAPVDKSNDVTCKLWRFDIMCVICGVRREDEKLILFTNKSLQKCSEVLQIRRDNGLKFKDVILPSAVNLTDGYHVKCYANFTALMKMYRDKGKSVDEKRPKTAIKCVICGKHGSKRPVLFTQKLSQKCNLMLQIRKENQLKFRNVTLPSRVSTSDRYHAKCYKKFTSSMRFSKIACVFCGERRDAKTLMFTEKSLEKCSEVLKIRKDNELKFTDVILPSAVNMTDGYHSKCYNNFIALMDLCPRNTAQESATLEASTSVQNTDDEFHQLLIKIEPSSPLADDSEQNLEENIESSTITCVICGEYSAEKSILFTEKSLQKCSEALQIRKHNGLKFKDVILPSAVSLTEGYHTKCYANFNALMRSYRENTKSFTTEQSTTLGASTSFENIHDDHHQVLTDIDPTLPLADHPGEDLDDTETSSPITCVICGQRGNVRVILFSERSLRKCNEVLRIRKDNKLKFKDIVLPPRVSETDGYHAVCYKNFTALTHSYREKSKPSTLEVSSPVENTHHQHQYLAENLEENITSSNITCAICNEYRNEKSILFTEKSLQRCRDVLQIRKNNELKFENVILPSCVNTTHGYHYKCYKYFTTLPHLYRWQIKSVAREQSTTLEVSSSVESTHHQRRQVLLRMQPSSPSAEGPAEKLEENTSAKITCVICGDTRDQRSILFFTEKSLQKCRKVLQIRKKHELKFQDVILPSCVNISDGYHIKCYKNFSALPHTYRGQTTSVSREFTTLRGSTAVENTHHQHHRDLIHIRPASPSAEDPAEDLEESMTPSKVTCFICDEYRDERSILFTEKSLQKCSEVLQIRKDNGLKFKEVILPSSVNITDGYHPKCYKYFTALPLSCRGKARSVNGEQSSMLEDSTSGENTHHRHQVLLKLRPSSPAADDTAEDLAENMTHSKFTCVICDEYRDDRSILFTERSLQKCKEVLQIRKNHKLKFKDVILPSWVNMTDGYHAKCYKYFTALPFSYRGKTRSITGEQSSMLEDSTSGENAHHQHHQDLTHSQPSSPSADDPAEDLEEDMTPSEITCVICDEYRDDRSILFTERSLQKCREVLQIRKNNKLKFKDVILPFCVNVTDGYHAKCYKYFNALPFSYRGKTRSGTGEQFSMLEDSTPIENNHHQHHQVLLKMQPSSPSSDDPAENLAENITYSKIACVICNEYRDERLILFTEKSLQKCKEVLQVRKNNELKFKNVILPSWVSTVDGYHAKCYKYFNALPLSYRGKTKSIAGEQSATLEDSTSVENTHHQYHQVLINQPSSPSGEDPGENLEESMTSSKITCVICGQYRDERSILFTEKSLQKCKEVLQIRKNNELKFKNVILPFCVNSSDGYHAKCYKYFTALTRCYRQRTESLTEDQYTPLETSASVETSHHEYHQVLKKNGTPSENLKFFQNSTAVCFFCRRNKKKYKGATETLRMGDKQSLKAIVEGYSTAVEDPDILERFEALIAPDISYHRSCKISYHNKAKQPVEPPQIGWHVSKDPHKAAYSELSKFVDQNVIQKGQCYFLTSLCDYYLDALQELGEENFDAYYNVSTPKRLETKMLNSFGSQIKIVTVHHRKVIVPKRHEGLDDEAFSRLEEAEILQKAALILRNRVLEMGTQELSGRANNSEGELLIPEDLNDFYVSLVAGTDGATRESYDCKKTAECLSQDVIHAVTDGRNRTGKTTKNLALGMSSKNRENSRKVVNVVDEYEHCSSYDVIEELEIGPEFIAMTPSSACLPEDQPLPDPFAEVEVHNSNGIGETEIGEGTPQDTVGFIRVDVDGTDDAGTNRIIKKEPRVANGGKRKRSDDDEMDEFD